MLPPTIAGISGPDYLPASDPDYIKAQHQRNQIMRDAMDEIRAVTGVKERDFGPRLSKPRLRTKHHIWSCKSGMPFVDLCIGYGYTPREAYDDWHQRMKARHG